jgi:hypothetical protein
MMPSADLCLRRGVVQMFDAFSIWADLGGVSTARARSQEDETTHLRLSMLSNLTTSDELLHPGTGNPLGMAREHNTVERSDFYPPRHLPHCHFVNQPSKQLCLPRSSMSYSS